MAWFICSISRGFISLDLLLSLIKYISTAILHSLECYRFFAFIKYDDIAIQMLSGPSRPVVWSGFLWSYGSVYLRNQ